MLSYIAVPAHFLWVTICQDGSSPLAGLLLAAGCTSLVVGVARSFYRPWLGKIACCVALAASGAFLICCMDGMTASPEVMREGQFVIAALWTIGLAAWGLFMSVRAIR